MCGKKALRGVGLLGMGLAAALFAHAAPVQAATGINQQLTFQGKVVNSSGVNLADGTYDMEFKIYQDGNSSGTGSTLMWTEDYLVPGSTGMPSTGGVTVSGGTFNVNLGSICALAGSTCGAKTNTGVDFNQDTLWLSFQVGNTSSCTVTSSTTSFHTGCGGDGEMTPFIRLTAVPQAMNANRVGGLTASQLVQLSPSGGTQTGTIDVSGNIKSGGQLQANTLDAAASGALSLGGTNATGITLLDNLTGGSSITATLQGTNALTLGSTSAAGGILFQDGTSNNRTVTLTTPGLANNYSLSWATSGATGNQCLQATSGSTNTVTALQWGSCGGGVSLAAVDSAGSANANGVTLTGTVLNLNSADGTHPGALNAGSQTIGGAKTFNALITGSAGLSVSGGAITLQGNSTSTLTTSSGNLTLDATSGSTPSILIGNGGQNKSITTGNSQSSTTVTLQGGATTETIANTGDTVLTTTNSNKAFQIQNASAEAIFLADTTTNNLITNPGFETGVTGWSCTNCSVAPSQNVTASKVYNGLSSLKFTTDASAGTTTAKVTSFTSTITANGATSYTFSFYMMADSAITLGSTVTFTGFTGTNTCTLNDTAVVTGGYKRFSCAVVNPTAGTLTDIDLTTTTVNAVGYIDGAQLVTGPTLTPYQIGSLQLRGPVVNPAIFQSTSASINALQVLDTASNAVLSVDTLNKYVQIGSATASTNGYLLVLNNYSNSNTEPTETDGAMYFNSAMEDFRCGENGAWQSCGINNIDHTWVIQDEFLGGNTVAAGATSINNVGSLGWTVKATTSCAVNYDTNGPGGQHDHPGWVTLQPGGASGDGCAMGGAGSAAGTFGLTTVLGTGDALKTGVDFQPGAGFGSMRVGWTNSTTNTAPTSGAWWELNTAVDASHWRYCYANNAAATCAAATATFASNAWYRLEVRIISSTAITFVMTQTTGTTTTESHPLTGITYDGGGTNKLTPVYTCFALGAAGPNCNVDYFQWRGVSTASVGR